MRKAHSIYTFFNFSPEKKFSATLFHQVSIEKSKRLEGSTCLFLPKNLDLNLLKLDYDETRLKRRDPETSPGHQHKKKTKTVIMVNMVGSKVNFHQVK